MPLLLAVAAGVLVADVVSKLLAVAQLTDREPISLLGGLLTLRLVRNPGAAFGMAQGLTIVFTCVAVGVVVVILRVARRLRSGRGRSRSAWCSAGGWATCSTACCAAPVRAAGTSWTSSSCRTGRCSTWPTRRSSSAAVLMVCSRPAGCSYDGTRAGQEAHGSAGTEAPKNRVTERARRDSLLM